MARSLDLTVLTSQPDANRNVEWEQAFFHALIDGKIKLDRPEPTAAPDGWPYLFVRTGKDATEPTVRVLEWLSSRGIGMIVNGQKEIPDYVFPYGMIWNWKERGQFISPSAAAPGGRVEFSEGEKVIAGAPRPEFLPGYVREVLYQFLSSQGVKSPKILLLSRDGKHYDLCFSLESLGNPPSHEHRGLAETLAWFLPQHYSLMLISEKGLPAFVNLLEK